MKKRIAIMIIVAVFAFTAQAQQNVRLELKNANVGAEQVYAQVNTSMLLTGEYLYYSVYCLEKGTNTWSSLSKIAYVSILNKAGEQVFNETLDLKNGKAYGDYFVPTNLPSGNYKLLAYTNWMKNNGQDSFFEQDLFIVNPYTSAQTAIRKDSLVYRKYAEKGNSGKLKITGNTYGKREKVQLELDNLPKGSYSVSVRQFDSIPHPSERSAVAFNQAISGKNTFENGSFTLPDLRGKLLSGQIRSSQGLSVSNKKIALSVPGEEYFLRIANTKDDGSFYFNVPENFTEEKAFVKVLDTAGYEIKLSEQQLPHIEKLEFEDYGVDLKSQKWIEDHSVYNQIENAYFSLKPDTVRVNQQSNLFDGLDQIEYVLDEYTRFKTVRETFVEVVPYARVRNENGKMAFRVLGKAPYQDFQGIPLVVIDGIPVSDPDEFIRNYESVKIYKIKVIQDKFYFGSALYKGVIIIQTFNADFAENYRDSSAKEIRLTSGNIRKNYFRQDYSKNDGNLPDFRTQLLWEPEFTGEQKDISFYTSDVPGIYEISIQGFTAEGEPVSIYGSFKVQ
ncbi:MAG: hypothetical protein ABGW91_05200 [Christiangramia sp.]